MKTISAAEANRHFSRLLREVARGERYTVMARGRPVAVVGPSGTGNVARRRSRQLLLQRLQGQSATGGRQWTRDALYD